MRRPSLKKQLAAANRALSMASMRCDLARPGTLDAERAEIACIKWIDVCGADPARWCRMSATRTPEEALVDARWHLEQALRAPPDKLNDHAWLMGWMGAGIRSALAVIDSAQRPQKSRRGRRGAA